MAFRLTSAFLLILRQTSATTPHVAAPLAEATLGATAGAAALGLVFGGWQLDIGWHAFGWLQLLAMTSGTAGWLLITSSLPRLPASLSSLPLLLQPAAAILLAAVVLGERPSPLQLAARCWCAAESSPRPALQRDPVGHDRRACVPRRRAQPQARRAGRERP